MSQISVDGVIVSRSWHVAWLFPDVGAAWTITHGFVSGGGGVRGGGGGFWLQLTFAELLPPACVIWTTVVASVQFHSGPGQPELGPA
jgi:hypothetical protein